MRLIVLCLFFSFISTSLLAQKRFIVSGTIEDRSTGEKLIGATVRIKELTNSGTTTNTYGFYSIALPAGNFTLVYSYIGYNTVEKPISARADQLTDIRLDPQKELSEIVIKSNKPNNDNVASPQMGEDKLNMAQANNVPEDSNNWRREGAWRFFMVSSAKIPAP